MYVIFNKCNHDYYWSNEWGWVEEDCADLFEDKKYNLPIDGEWEKV